MKMVVIERIKKLLQILRLRIDNWTHMRGRTCCMVNSCPGKNVEVSIGLLNLLTCSKIIDGILFFLLLLNRKDPRLYPCRPQSIYIHIKQCYNSVI